MSAEAAHHFGCRACVMSREHAASHGSRSSQVVSVDVTHLLLEQWHQVSGGVCWGRASAARAPHAAPTGLSQQF